MHDRFRSASLHILEHEKIEGNYAGDLYRVHAADTVGSSHSYIYKQVATDRANELVVLKHLKAFMSKYAPEYIAIYHNDPQAFIQRDAGTSIKKSFMTSPLPLQQKRLGNIADKLFRLHRESYQIAREIEDNELLIRHRPNPEWGDWAIQNLKKIDILDMNVFEKIERIIHEYYHAVRDYESPVVTLTHGDPHFDNVFVAGDDVLFIDWEWAGLSSPLRDVSLLIQDVYNMELIQQIVITFCEKMLKRPFSLSLHQCKQDFAVWCLDSTIMMLAWEIDAFCKGSIDRSNLDKIVSGKLALLFRYADEFPEKKVSNHWKKTT